MGSQDPFEALRRFAREAEGLPLALKARVGEGGEVLRLEAAAGGRGEGRVLRLGGKEDEGGFEAFLGQEGGAEELVLDHPLLLLRWRGEDLLSFPRGLLAERALEGLRAGAKALSLLLEALEEPLALQAARDLAELSAFLEDPAPSPGGRGSSWRRGRERRGSRAGTGGASPCPP